MSSADFVVLVDEKDNKIGVEEKLKAHQNGGRLHRAFSIFVFNSQGYVMLQRRALTKYHACGLWTNTCCSHPPDGESVVDAAHRRLKEEMGFDCGLREIFSFIYHADVGNGLRENEYDHVIIGRHDGAPKLNKDEAMGWKFVSMQQLEHEIRAKPSDFTPWLVIAMPKLSDWIKNNTVDFRNL